MDYSRLLFVWRLAGFIMGFVPALFGVKAAFATINAVESFVDDHYKQQINQIGTESTLQEVRMILERCRIDEINHRDEARQLIVSKSGYFLRLWCYLVHRLSMIAVAVAWRV